MSQLASSDDQSYRLEYLSSQLDLIASKPEGRKYTSAQYRQTIDLCLRGRHAYNALRNICILPSMESIHKLFGNMSTARSLSCIKSHGEHERYAKMVQGIDR